MLRDDEIQHGVAEKTERAVVAGAGMLVGKRAMRQRLLEQRPVGEPVGETFFKGRGPRHRSQQPLLGASLGVRDEVEA